MRHFQNLTGSFLNFMNLEGNPLPLLRAKIQSSFVLYMCTHHYLYYIIVIHVGVGNLPRLNESMRHQEPQPPWGDPGGEGIGGVGSSRWMGC